MGKDTVALWHALEEYPKAIKHFRHCRKHSRLNIECLQCLTITIANLAVEIDRLKEGNFGHVYSNTKTPSTDATPPAESSGGIRQRENSMGRRWSGEEPYYTSVLFDEGEPG